MASLTRMSLTLTLIALVFTSHQTQGVKEAGKKSTKYVPVGPAEHRRQVALPAAAEGYQPFRLCMGCRCCSSTNQSDCMATSCCYAINCNLPGKPFGICALSPQSCDCTNCTQS